MKALVIEDDPSTVEVISFALRVSWPNCTVLSTRLGAEGFKMVEEERPDIVLLALLLPDMDGLHVLSRIRSFSDVPLIVVSARGDVTDRVRGLEAGADDYVVKPFKYTELAARVKAVLRRISGLYPSEQGPGADRVRPGPEVSTRPTALREDKPDTY